MLKWAVAKHITSALEELIQEVDEKLGRYGAMLSYQLEIAKLEAEDLANGQASPLTSFVQRIAEDASEEAAVSAFRLPLQQLFNLSNSSR